ncbi:hypothetical protein [Nocardioides houyundeii]|uniref:hypothetical protein n=1 Tax=Nocardioides houyundeii TaxID=2045452 RepID=UPI0013158FF8|nr:hypothetical protein [Nocardioides houyundeii]
MSVRHALQMQAAEDSQGITVTMSRAELIALRELIAFMDFTGDLPSRSRGEDLVAGAFLRAADPLIPELGTDGYGLTVEAAWSELAGT